MAKAGICQTVTRHKAQYMSTLWMYIVIGCVCVYVLMLVSSRTPVSLTLSFCIVTDSYHCLLHAKSVL